PARQVASLTCARPFSTPLLHQPHATVDKKPNPPPGSSGPARRRRKALTYLPGDDALSNSNRQPREAAVSGARTQTERNGCLPLAARSGWASSLFCSDRNG